MKLDEIKEKLAQSCRILEMEGLTEKGRGHFAFRHPDGDKLLIPGHLHDYGRAIGDVLAEDIVTIDFDGRVLEGRYPEPMGEFQAYTSIFRHRDDVHGVAHFHPTYANILAASGKRLVPVTRDGCLFYEGVGVYEGFPLYCGTRQMGDEIAVALGKGRAVLHRAHGAFVVGRTVEETLVTAVFLEKAARDQVYTAILGSVTPIPPERMTEREKNPDAHVLDDFFGYYCGKLARLEKQRQPMAIAG